MEKEMLRPGKKYEELTGKTAKHALLDGGLSASIWKLCQNRYGQDRFQEFWSKLRKVSGKDPMQIQSPEEFWSPKMRKAVSFMVGGRFEKDMEEMSVMLMECQFSKSMYRRSYRSHCFSYHIIGLLGNISDWIYWTTYDKSVTEAMFCNHDFCGGYDKLLALECGRNNAEVVNLIKEAILGDNSNIVLSSAMIRAIIISGHEELLTLLLKLLLAARLQEGLRQQILEAADAGGTTTFMKILKVCIEEDLFRYSSSIRAFATWTGLNFDNEKPAVVKKYASLAYEYLSNPKERETSLDSENNLEAYLAIWAMACYETADCERYVEKLLDDPRKYRKALGWYFITTSDSPLYKMKLAEKYLAERDEELLAWITANLTVSRNISSYSMYMKREYKCIDNPVLPDTPEAQRALFDRLSEVAEYIGGKNKSFDGNPFPYSHVEFHNVRVLACMMSIAALDMDKAMVLRLAEYVKWMDVSERGGYYSNLLRPDLDDRHRQIIMEGLNDRSVQIKELVVKILSECALTQEDLVILTDALVSKSSTVRKAILGILQAQPADKMETVIKKLLTATNENLVQAGIELLLQSQTEAAAQAAQPSQGKTTAQAIQSSQGNTTAQATQPSQTKATVAAQPSQVKYAAEIEQLSTRKISSQTQILLDRLTGQATAQQKPDQNGDSRQSIVEYTPENGFGLFSQEYISGLLNNRQFPADFMKGNTLYTDKALKKLLLITQDDVMSLMKKLNQVYEAHADYEYNVLHWDGSIGRELLGTLNWQQIPMPAESGQQAQSTERCLDKLPFAEEFVQGFGAYATDLEKYISLLYCTDYSNSTWEEYIGKELEYQDWFLPYTKSYFYVCLSSYSVYGTRSNQMREFTQLLVSKFDSHEVFSYVYPIYVSLLQFYGIDNIGRNTVKKGTDRYSYMYANAGCYPINMRGPQILRKLIQRLSLNDEDFQKWFTLEYYLEKKAAVSIFQGLNLKDYFRACSLKLMHKDILYDRLLLGRNAGNEMAWMTTKGGSTKIAKDILGEYEWASDFIAEIVERVVSVEEKRGELPTSVTPVASSIKRIEGIQHFTILLAALGKENFFRGYAYAGSSTKQSVLSGLLKKCYPAKTDTPQQLRESLKATDISDKRLAEAVMYAPQWADFAEKILGWEGLKCAVWFFHAHINENFTAEKETEVAYYSPITPQQFNDGAFDQDWFFKAYHTLGEKRFQILYKSAKYITSGSNQHRRSQLYADAVLGKLNAEEIREEVIQKRNQEKLRCYPLIPIAGEDTAEALRRYEFIQQFLKESRQFGAQRKESEKKACMTALENLAITTGFRNVDRMTWFMESEKLEEIRPLLAPQTLEECQVWLEIGPDGTAEVAIEKAGKRLKTVPKSIAKNETILLLKDTAKQLKEQRSRARKTLEKSMVEQTAFTVQELIRIENNPVLSPLLQNLVFCKENQRTECGFLQEKEGKLYLYPLQEYAAAQDSTGMAGENAGSQLTEDAQICIAHPHDLMQTGSWSGYMHFFYQNKRIQPFKQVFREYYPVTEDEKQEKNVSRRYAGNQVQPQKTVALLKGCGWTVDYEEGLQKVCYKENIIVRMYALADWFSPADIEAPTLEVIRFYDRKTEEVLDFEKVPPILFSEAMRDIDLVVSVAHVGGVDPEASHSTVEMRRAIAEELLAMLKVTNVSFTDNHARIIGKLGTYSVHIGSGVVHMEAHGMLAILPVHSQARGRIFLPFADDDPKTAEIMSKILLLAEDHKIKDPTILRQM